MAASNVVRLPTAAKQKVRQPATRSCRRYMKARAELPQFPKVGGFAETSYWTETRRQAEMMLDRSEAAIMQMALAMFRVLDDKDKIRVQGGLLGLVLRNRPGAKEALAWLTYENASKQRKQEIDLAAIEIASERGLEGLGK